MFAVSYTLALTTLVYFMLQPVEYLLICFQCCAFSSSRERKRVWTLGTYLHIPRNISQYTCSHLYTTQVLLQQQDSNRPPIQMCDYTPAHPAVPYHQFAIHTSGTELGGTATLLSIHKDLTMVRTVRRREGDTKMGER